MAQELPRFLSLFGNYRPDPAIVQVLTDWQVEKAVVDKQTRALRVTLSCPLMPAPALCHRVETELAQAYQVDRAILDLREEPAYKEEIPLPEPPGEETLPPEIYEEVPVSIGEPAIQTQHMPEENAGPVSETFPTAMDPFQITEELRRKAMASITPANSAGKKMGKPPDKAGKMIFGQREPRGAVTPMSELTLDMGTVVVEGDVFAVNHRELAKRNAWVVSFDITDHTGSVRINKFFPGNEGKPLVEGVKEGQHLKIQGRLNIDKFTNDLVMEPYAVQQGEKQQRQDRAKEKRVELHLHTTMSSMDAITPTKDVVKRAESWGHRAIAITDHGVTQSFPDAWHAAKNIKVLYGVEAYFINDMDDRVVVHGQTAQDFHGEIVCFDIETTGLSKTKDLIIEIGAAVLRDGEICETFNTFVAPRRSLPREIIELTGITDKMLEGAPGQEEAVNAFLDFVGERPLAAHNAEFDMGFIAQACERMGRKLPNPWVDSLILAQNLLPDLKNFKLDTVANHLNLPAFNHHRASDDAGTVGYMLIPFFKMLEEMGVHDLQGINPAMVSLRGKGKARRQPKHLIILARNQQGLRTLYRLVSDSFLKYYKRNPIIPKSELEKDRAGLILGSACEAGELYQAVAARKDWEELKRIASWYDFLEIQPLCNNAFMLRPDKNGKTQVDSEEELREFNRTILSLGKELDKPVCATGDVHFLEPEDEIYRHILLDSKGFEDCDQPLPIYFKTTNEMLEEFSYLGEEDCRKVVIRNPNLIADMCEKIEPLPKGLFAPKLENSAQELENLVWNRAHELYGEEPPQIVVDRINDELGDIIRCKYDVIYMSAQKLVQNSLEHGYLVGSRGSVGSSLVAFMSGITEVNSLPAHYRCTKCKHTDFDFGPANGYGCGADMPDAVCPVCGTPYAKDGFDIPFQTFLGFGGDKVPDIDLNFSDEYQAKAHRYTFELFGETHVFRAGTIGTVAAKTAYGYVKKYMEKRGIRASAAEENRLAIGCTGVKRTTGQHPGGMVVIPQDREIYDFCPVQHPAEKEDAEIITTHFEYHAMESNLLKLDMLGHQDPTMVRMLEDLTGINARELPLDDKDTMSLFTTSEKLGYVDDPVLGPTGAVAIPEFNTRFTRGVLEETKPTQFDMLLRISGFTHGTDVWLGNARDLILSGTTGVSGCVGCRDDIMLFLISKGMAPQRSFKIMESVRKGRGLPDGAEEEMRQHEVPDWYIDSCKKIAYLFPKAHAVAYVMMAFRIAWFKVHRPLAFYAAFFSIRAKAFDATIMCQGMDMVKNKMREIKARMDDKLASAVEEDTYTTLEVVYEFYLRGFTFHTMNLYRSDAGHFLPDGEDALIPPFTAIPGLGESAAQSIVEQRVGREFISIEEFADACPKVSKTHIEQLKDAGAFEDMPDTSQITLF